MTFHQTPVPRKPAASVSRANVDPSTIETAREVLSKTSGWPSLTEPRRDDLTTIIASTATTAHRCSCAVAERCPAVGRAIVALECADRQAVADGVRFAMAGGFGRVAAELAGIIISDPHAAGAVATARAQVDAALDDVRAAAE
jgi:hypothetical protein